MTALSQYLAEQSISQQEFASRIGVTQSQVSRLVSGRLNPSPMTAHRIAAETNGAVPFHTWPAFAVFAPDKVAQ